MDITSDNPEISKQITFLVRHRQSKEVKLVMLKVDPWKVIDRSLYFDLPETFFVIEGNVAQPPKTALPGEYSDDKIKSIEIL